MKLLPPDPHALISADISAFAHTWGIPTLPARVTAHYSTRLRSSLGRCTPARGEVRLAAALATRDPDLHREVLCHEVAHVAVHLLHGPGCRPHGPEWAALMRRAGYEPRVRFPREAAAHVLPPPGAGYQHLCPVCQMTRVARRVVRWWRCKACVESGLSGELAIRRVGP